MCLGSFVVRQLEEERIKGASRYWPAEFNSSVLQNGCNGHDQNPPIPLPISRKNQEKSGPLGCRCFQLTVLEWVRMVSPLFDARLSFRGVHCDLTLPANLSGCISNESIASFSTSQPRKFHVAVFLWWLWPGW
jgi:hypothetical protein